MCLIALANAAHPRYRLVVAANRDEWYARPAAPLNYWADAPQTLAGRDLQGGGTWMGVSLQGRFAALTNYREPKRKASPKLAPPSRGQLVSDFLATIASAIDYADSLRESAAIYDGYNLLLDDGTDMVWCSNRGGKSLSSQRLEVGIHGVSNGTLNAAWPKVARVKEGLARALDRQGDNPEALTASLLALLADQTVAQDADLPATGVPLLWERALSPVFISASAGEVHANYGTRASTVLLLTHDGFGRMVEVSHAPTKGRIDKSFRLRAGCGD